MEPPPSPSIDALPVPTDGSDPEPGIDLDARRRNCRRIVLAVAALVVLGSIPVRPLPPERDGAVIWTALGQDEVLEGPDDDGFLIRPGSARGRGERMRWVSAHDLDATTIAERSAALATTASLGSATVEGRAAAIVLAHVATSERGSITASRLVRLRRLIEVSRYRGSLFELDRGALERARNELARARRYPLNVALEAAFFAGLAMVCLVPCRRGQRLGPMRLFLLPAAFALPWALGYSGPPGTSDDDACGIYPLLVRDVAEPLLAGGWKAYLLAPLLGGPTTELGGLLQYGRGPHLAWLAVAGASLALPVLAGRCVERAGPGLAGDLARAAVAAAVGELAAFAFLCHVRSPLAGRLEVWLGASSPTPPSSPSPSRPGSSPSSSSSAAPAGSDTAPRCCQSPPPPAWCSAGRS